MADEKLNLIKEELNRAKEDLGDLEMYIKEFSSFLPLAVCTVNPIEIIININQVFQALTGYDSLEINGEHLAKIFLEKEKIKNLLNLTRKRGKVRTKELVLILKDRKEIPVNVSVSIRKDRDGNFIGYFLALFDITEIKKFREELEGKVKIRTKELEDSRKALINMLEDVEEAREKTEEEKNKTLAVITNLADGLLVFDATNNLSIVNPQAEEFFKVKSKDLIDKSILELTKIPEFSPLVRILGKEIKEIYRRELTVRKDLTLEMSTVSLIREKEKLGTLIILHNITREKLVEKMKTEFVSLSAHQLRTPLSSIKWALKMLLDGDIGKITEEQRDFIKKTYQSNERMIALINDLLDVTRIEEGKYLYNPVFTQIENIIQSVINYYQREIKRKKIKFEFKKAQKKFPKLKIDVEKMKVAIGNLLDNAIRYTQVGGTVTFFLDCVKNKVEFSIHDTGIGISIDQQERIFTKFFRGANAVQMETEGTGLGLYIAKNIIEAHNGKIWFKSNPKKGTTFYFNLPVEKEFEEFLKKF